ncbi:thiosulfate sulfurtransferase 16, chloroplastic-like [Euphorbia lathyris]|uniref:thiosulfate sulfurtransferase 16, chloroplastic-like n=1 Tax=Euphorbia lathyris TaxID=212925 RepID=UPI0033135CC0
MAAKSIVSSTFFTRFSPLIPPSDLNHRNLLVLPWAINSKKWSSGVNQKGFRFCTKAGQKGNLEAVGVPTSVPVRVAHELLLAGHRFLDVRTAEEFSAGHTLGAINVPYLYRAGLGMAKNPKFVEEVSSYFGKYDEILVGCQIGKRSMMAATELLAAGYTGITDVAGGYAAWTQNGLPTEN